MSLYLDTSALVKLLVREPESGALRDYLRSQQNAVRAVSSLARTELRRAAARSSSSLTAGVDKLLGRLTLLRVDDALMDTAGRLPPASLRSLDALHLASALRIPSLTALVTYDERMAQAAAELGMPVAAPGA